MKTSNKPNIVYVVGAGLSAGLDFPVIDDLLPRMWRRIKRTGLDVDLAKVIRFHHPDFNYARSETYPNIEQLLSEMAANAQLFDSSRPATGNFTSDDLEERRQRLLLELANWFHELQKAALRNQPPWLKLQTFTLALSCVVGFTIKSSVNCGKMARARRRRAGQR